MPSTIQQKLDEAKDAYHKLQLGIAPRLVVDMDGTRVEFTSANRDKLYAYIQTLQSQLNIQASCGAGANPGGLLVGPGSSVGSPGLVVPGVISTGGPLQFLF